MRLLRLDENSSTICAAADTKLTCQRAEDIANPFALHGRSEPVDWPYHVSRGHQQHTLPQIWASAR